MAAAPRATARGGSAVASNIEPASDKRNGGIEVLYGDVRRFVRVACGEGCHVAPLFKNKHGIGDMRPLPPVILDDRRGYVFRDGAGYRFVWRGGVGSFLAGHPGARICAVSCAAVNGGRFTPLAAAEQEKFLLRAMIETTVDDARSAGITRGCSACQGTHSTMRRSGVVGYLFDGAFVDAGCVWAHAAKPWRRRVLQFLAWSADRNRLMPAIQAADAAFANLFVARRLVF
ncbi:MAG: hypothetical protein A3A44_02410 [Candidatus Sungbacteria bacterium RIFCSPLOWO2_01_FULL_60_25]|uniref:Uncharacterized protein n=1 Tax=Candidatus Sungbacteria bacterium RIFCSPLOWO2_01_FULL_60_25 TaxID=1802281 RepID=A0A1G2L9H7_9BACT|nr:MAG: hypothetical protein A3A44_02410 [Candidatus Sungbacteria bacterium RIFCSPLOWO2_01_FULL_60_25]